jgi:Ni/Co efflux regulator RcnB
MKKLLSLSFLAAALSIGSVAFAQATPPADEKPAEGDKAKDKDKDKAKKAKKDKSKDKDGADMGADKDKKPAEPAK